MLQQANQRWHQLLEVQYQSLLEALTELELILTRSLWSSFRNSLLEHLDFEQKHIEPLADTWENNTLKLIRADHLILSRLLPRLETAIERIEASSAPRTELVIQLDTFIKLRNVLTHHDERENLLLYPLLDQQLSSESQQVLAAKMDAARQRMT